MPTPLVRSGKWNNQLQTIALVFALGCLNVLVGWLLFGNVGVWAALILTLLGVMLAPGLSPATVLRMYHAQPVTHPAAPELMQLFNDLKRNAALPIPVSLFYVPSKLPNAFAVGNQHEAAVAVSDGLLRILPPRELAGVLGHELAHIRHNDLRVMVTADAVARVTSTFARIGFLMLLFGFPAFLMGGFRAPWLVAGAVLFLAPTVAVFLQLALSRSREFNADLGAVELTHDPRGLAMALERIERVARGGWLRRWLGNSADRGQPAWLRTHPPTEERVARLLAVEQSLGDPPVSTHPGPPHFDTASPRHIPLATRPRVHTRPGWHPASGLWY